jgi:hypothetical protein
MDHPRGGSRLRLRCRCGIRNQRVRVRRSGVARDLAIDRGRHPRRVVHRVAGPDRTFGGSSSSFMGRVVSFDIPRLRDVSSADVRPIVAERRRIEQALPVAIDVRLLKIDRLLAGKLGKSSLAGLGVRDPLSLQALKVGVHLERRGTSLADVLGVRRERLLLTLLRDQRPEVLEVRRVRRLRRRRRLRGLRPPRMRPHPAPRPIRIHVDRAARDRDDTRLNRRQGLRLRSGGSHRKSVSGHARTNHANGIVAVIATPGDQPTTWNVVEVMLR